MDILKRIKRLRARSARLEARIRELQEKQEDIDGKILKLELRYWGA